LPVIPTFPRGGITARRPAAGLDRNTRGLRRSDRKSVHPYRFSI